MSKMISSEHDPILNPMMTSQKSMNRSVSSVLQMKKEMKGVELKDLHNILG